jgi:hypothetical protein
MAIAPTNPSATNVLVTSMGSLLFLFLSPTKGGLRLFRWNIEGNACSVRQSKRVSDKPERFRCHVREPNGSWPRGVSKRKRKSATLKSDQGCRSASTAKNFSRCNEMALSSDKATP